ncbi:peptidoglycan amidohydrolase family protein [Evansella cellulosilytica]|nr:peptidoglycan amidohydrolase family protein [Evansella cellulosilytica]
MNDDIYLRTDLLPSGSHLFHLVGEVSNYGETYTVEESYPIDIEKRTTSTNFRSHTFKPGDILVASDNKKGIPNGYMGHAIIMVDNERILESDYQDDSIAVNHITKFFKDHEWYALYRPINEKMGELAVNWGLAYHEKYKKNVNQGVNKPLFSFLPSKLTDLWSTIYCTKLVWLCYYYGANYDFSHEGLWISPYQLDNQLKKDKNFQLIYEHPKHYFKLKV